MKMMIDKMKLNKTQNEAKFHEDAKSSMYNSLQKKQDDCRKCDGMMEEERAGLSNLALLLPGQCRPCPAETEGVQNSTTKRKCREIDKPEKSAPGAQSPDGSQKCKRTFSIISGDNMFSARVTTRHRVDQFGSNKKI